MRAPSRRRTTATVGDYSVSHPFYFINVNFLVLVNPGASIR